MTDREALAAMEKKLACNLTDLERCGAISACERCPHFVDPEKFCDALVVAVQALREKVEKEAGGQ